MLNHSARLAMSTCVLKALPGKLDIKGHSLPGSVLRTHVESLGKPRDSTSILKALPGKLDIKRHSLPGSALRTHVESLGKPPDVNKRSQSLAW